MAAYPEFMGPDGVLRTNYILSTTSSQQFFTGTIPADTADVQVSIRGGAFSSDPDYITFEGTSFTVPNPSAFPDGLQLLTGDNEIKVKCILTNGSATQEARVNATLSVEADIAALVEAPTGIYLERFNATVQVTVEGIADNDNVSGYHFYASPQPGGGDIGYFRINPSLILSGTVVETEIALASLSVDANIEVDAEGFHAADPLFFRLTGKQEDSDETVLATNFDEVMEVPETTSKVRIATTITTLEQSRKYTFEHDRQATLESTYPALPHSDLSTVPETDPLYYVATAVHLIDGEEYESFFSPEVLGAPLRILPAVGAFPQVSRQQMVRSSVLSIYRSQPQVRVDPGSALRDTFIDPFTTEADRIRFIIDFMHNAQSFVTLLLIDDPTLSGESIPVSQSSYKTALREAFYLTTDAEVQTIIDNAFEKLASNNGVVRDNGKRARGEVTFFVTTQPTTSITKTIGTILSGGGTNFRTTSTALITTAGTGRGYDPSTGRYYARAFIQADLAGSAGNLSAGQIKVISNNTLNVQVTNESATFGGTDRESNAVLALRAMRVLASVDSGTLQGYVNNATNTAGVAQVSVIDSGHALMMRDRNEDGRHVGGKVDIYLRGNSEAKVTDTFAFSFNTRQHWQFEPVGDLADLRFRAIDPALSADNPLIEMLNLPSIDRVFENTTKSIVFDLTGVTYVAYNEIKLDSTYNDPTAHSITDIFQGAYRYRTSDRFVFTRQPVMSITRFEGEQTGILVSTVYDLFRASDPLVLGRSTNAGDYIKVTEALSGGATVPSSTPIVVSGEEHTMLDGIEYLDKLGANFLTVEVWNADRTVQYDGPLESAVTQDFTFIDGDETTPLGILLTSTSAIAEGQTVLVDYSHDENFTVEYLSNAVVRVVQDNIDEDSHITADAIAKWALPIPVDINATVVLRPNANSGTVDGSIRTALARLFGSFTLGLPVRQSDIIRVIDAVTDVDYVVTPLTKMARGDDATVVRETVLTDSESDSTLITAWSTATVSTYLIGTNIALDSATTDAGGPINEFRGVFQDEVRLTHHETPPNINGFPLRVSAGAAFIIGADGLVIPGYSDDVTIEARYSSLPADPDEKAAEILRLRKELTANRALVTFTPGGDIEDNPVLHDYAITYVVDTDTEVKNIDPGPIEYLTVGNLNFVYDEAT
jgi:hypothetical protein